jgi:outer membrane receptor protein involved in Fe transport
MAVTVGGVVGLSVPAVAQTAVPTETQASADASATVPGDIIVTATRRSEALRNIPSSISALSQKSIEDSGAKQVADIVAQVPGFAYTQNSVGQAVLSIRGIQTSASFGNVQMPVAIYYNDVPVLDPYIPWTVPQLNLFDVQRVEVLRGPQGTLFGAGALSGALRVLTNKADTGKFDAATENTVQTTKGGGVGYNVNGMVNIPIIKDILAVRAVGYYNHVAGWIDNPTLGQKNGNRASVRGGRIAVEWAPSDQLEVTATASQEITRPHDSSFVPYGSKRDTANNRVRNYNDDNTKIANLAINYTMPWATLTSSTSYIHRDAFASTDFSGVAGAYTGVPTPAPLTDEFTTKNFLQEIRLSSGSGQPFRWVVGGFLERYRFSLYENIIQAGFTAPGVTPNSVENVLTTARINDEAVFADASYDILSKLTLSAGIRYAHYSTSTTLQSGVTGPDFFFGPPTTYSRNAKFNAVTPKVSLSYKPTEEVMVYALANRGFRNGNSNLLPLTDPFSGLPLPSSYGPDHLWNYEVGTKLALFDRRLRVDLSAFYIDWSKIQLTVAAPVSGFNYVDNVGQARSKGIEATIAGNLTDHLEAGTTLTYTHARLTSVATGVTAQVGDQLPGSAPFTAYAYGQYRVPLSGAAGLSLRADYSYVGREYAYLNNRNNAAALEYGRYSSVGARAELDLGKLAFTVFVQNLTDSRGKIAAKRLYPDPVEVRQTPRTVGLTVRARM